jgi:predicted alpha/beta-fold hydrolase
MLDWLACLFAPKIRDLHEAPPVALPEPRPEPEMLERVRVTFAELAELPFHPRAGLSAHDALMAMGCRDLVTREADQHPDTAGRTDNYAALPAFQEVAIPGSDGVSLTGRRSTGAPGAPVVIVVHGLYDSHTSRYVVEFSEVLRRWGFHVVALDMRDHGRLRGRPPVSSLGVAEGRDLFAAARALSAAEGVSVGILGISFGGQCAVRAAHEATQAGTPEVLRGGVLALSAPLDVPEAVAALDDPTRLPRPRGLKAWLIDRELRSVFVRHLRLRIAEHGPFESPCRDYRDYIREVLLPAEAHPPPSLEAWLEQASCARTEVLGAVAVPVGIVHAVDDMLVPVHHLRAAREAAAGNPFVATFELPAGGHAGFAVLDPAGTMSLLATFFGRLRDG